MSRWRGGYQHVAVRLAQKELRGGASGGRSVQCERERISITIVLPEVESCTSASPAWRALTWRGASLRLVHCCTAGLASPLVQKALARMGAPHIEQRVH